MKSVFASFLILALAMPNPALAMRGEAVTETPTCSSLEENLSTAGLEETAETGTGSQRTVLRNPWDAAARILEGLSKDQQTGLIVASVAWVRHRYLGSRILSEEVLPDVNRILANALLPTPPIQNGSPLSYARWNSSSARALRKRGVIGFIVEEKNSLRTPHLHHPATATSLLLQKLSERKDLRGLVRLSYRQFNRLVPSPALGARFLKIHPDWLEEMNSLVNLALQNNPPDRRTALAAYLLWHSSPAQILRNRPVVVLVSVGKIEYDPDKVAKDILQRITQELTRNNRKLLWYLEDGWLNLPCEFIGNLSLTLPRGTALRINGGKLRLRINQALQENFPKTPPAEQPFLEKGIRQGIRIVVTKKGDLLLYKPRPLAEQIILALPQILAQTPSLQTGSAVILSYRDAGRILGNRNVHIAFTKNRALKPGTNRILESILEGNPSSVSAANKIQNQLKDAVQQLKRQGVDLIVIRKATLKKRSPLATNDEDQNTGLEEVKERETGSEGRPEVSQVWVPELGRYLSVHKGVFTPDSPISRMFLRFILDHPDSFRDLRVLETGIGSGVLTIGLSRIGAHVTGVDILPQAVQDAEENLSGEENPRKDGVRIGLSDLFENLNGITQEAIPQFDVLISDNPVRNKEPVAQISETYAIYSGEGHRVNREMLSYLPKLQKGPHRAGYFLAIEVADLLDTEATVGERAVARRKVMEEFWTEDKLRESLPEGWGVEEMEGDSLQSEKPELGLTLKFSIYRVSPAAGLEEDPLINEVTEALEGIAGGWRRPEVQLGDSVGSLFAIRILQELRDAQMLRQEVARAIQWLRIIAGNQDVAQAWADPSKDQGFLRALWEVMKGGFYEKGFDGRNKVIRHLVQGHLSLAFLREVFRIDPEGFQKILSGFLLADDRSPYVLGIIPREIGYLPNIRKRNRLLKIWEQHQAPFVPTVEEFQLKSFAEKMPGRVAGLAYMLEHSTIPGSRFWSDRIHPSAWADPKKALDLLDWVDQHRTPLSSLLLQSQFAWFKRYGIEGQPLPPALEKWSNEERIGRMDRVPLIPAIAALELLLKNPSLRRRLEQCPEEAFQIGQGSLAIPGENWYGNLRFVMSLRLDLPTSIHEAKRRFYQENELEITPPFSPYRAGLEELPLPAAQTLDDARRSLDPSV